MIVGTEEDNIISNKIKLKTMIYYQQTGYAAGRSRPTQALPANEKDEKWCRENVEWIYSQHYNSWLYNLQLGFARLRDYANGMQNTDPYKDLLGVPRKDERKKMLPQGPEGIVPKAPFDMLDYTSIDFTKVLSPAPKIIDKVIGMLDATDYKIHVSAVDKSSLRDKKAMKNKIKVMMQQKDWLSQVNQKAGMEIVKMPDVMPQSEEEINLVEKLGGFDLKYEKGLRKSINWTEDYSDKPDISDSMKRDALITGVMACCDVIQDARKVVLWEHIDPENLILEYSAGSNKYDSSYWGRQKFYTIMDLRILTGWDEEKLYNLAGQWCNNSDLGNSIAKDQLELPTVFTATGLCNYNDIKIPCIEAEWKSTDVVNDNSETQRKVRINGKVRQAEIDKGRIKQDNEGYYKYVTTDKEGNELKSKKLGQLCVNYQATWVIGTGDLLPGYGKKYVNTYDQTSKDSPLSVHVYFCKGKSLIERAIPMLDNFAIAGYKFMNDIASAFPTNTVVYEVGAIERVAAKLSEKGGEVKPFDLIKKGKQDGILLWSYDSKMLPSDMKSGTSIRPVEFLQGAGILKSVQELDAAMNSFNAHLANLIGIDPQTSVSKAPNSEQTAKGMEMQQDNSLDTLKVITKAWLSCYTGLASNTAIRVQLIAAGSKKSDATASGYKDIMTDEEWQAMIDAGTPTSDRPLPVYYNIKMKPKIDNNTKEKILQTAQLATVGSKNEAPTMKQSEYLLVVNSLNDGADIKDIAYYLSYKEKKKEEMQQQIAQQAEQTNTQRGQEMEQMKHKNTMDETQLDYDLALRNAVEIERQKALGKVLVNKENAENEINKAMQLDEDVQGQLKNLLGIPPVQQAGQPQPANTGQPQQ